MSKAYISKQLLRTQVAYHLLLACSFRLRNGHGHGHDRAHVPSPLPCHDLPRNDKTCGYSNNSWVPEDSMVQYKSQLQNQLAKHTKLGVITPKKHKSNPQKKNATLTPVLRLVLNLVMYTLE